MAPYLDSEWLQVEEEMGGRLTLGPTFEEYQAGGRKIGAYIHAHSPSQVDDGLEVVDDNVNENIACRIYRPKQSLGLIPLGVFYHGGGFSDGSIDMEDHLCRVIAASFPCIIVSIDYRLSTQVNIKVVYQDAFDGFLWAYKNALRFGGDQSKVFMFGSSCGGTLSLATVHKLIEVGNKGLVKGVINLAGGTVDESNVPKHLQDLYRSIQENANDAPIIDRACTITIAEQTGLKNLASDDYMFPLLSSHLAEFPRTYLVSCGADPLRDDNVLLEHELREKGVPVKLDMFDGLPHVFWMFPNLKATTLFFDKLRAGITFVLQ